MTTPEGSEPSPADSLARTAAEIHADLAEAAADPRLPDRDRRIFGAVGEMSIDAAASSARTQRGLEHVNEQYDTIAAVLLGDDMSVLAGILKRRLTREQLADLVVRLDSPA